MVTRTGQVKRTGPPNSRPVWYLVKYTRVVMYTKLVLYSNLVMYST